VAHIMSPANTDTLSSVSDEQRGQVSGLVQTIRQLGGALGVAFAACIGGFAKAGGAPLSSSIGFAILGGACVAALGIALAFAMPSALPRRAQ